MTVEHILAGMCGAGILLVGIWYGMLLGGSVAKCSQCGERKAHIEEEQ